MTEASLSADGFVWLVSSLCRTYQIPWNGEQALRLTPPPLNGQRLADTTQGLGLRLSEERLDRLDWTRVRFPIVVFSISPASQDSAKTPCEPALIVRADASRALYFSPGSRHPRVVEIGRLAEQFEPLAYSLAKTGPKSAESTDAPDVSFGFEWFVRELARYRRVWRDVLIASFAIQIVGLAVPLFTQAVIDKVVVHHTYGTLAAIAAGLFVSVAFGALLSWLRQYLVSHTGGRVDAALGSQIFWHLVRLPIPYFDQRATGTLTARVHAVETIREFISGAAITLLLDLPFLLLFLGVMSWYSWQLTLVALALIFAIALISALVTPVFRRRLNHQFLLGAKNQAFLTEYVSGIETVKGLQMETQLRRRYDEILAGYVSAGVSVRQLSGAYTVAASALEQLMTITILCVGAMLVMENPGFTIGMLIAFQMFASRVSQPMLRLAGLWQEFQQSSIAVRRLGDIMNAPCERHEWTSLRKPERAGRIDVTGVSFRYPGRPNVLSNFSVSLLPGRLAFVSGPSGSGKSTLIRLLLGFQLPDEGHIYLDGTDHRHYSVSELRHYFGVVPQETVLFSGTVFENLQWADPHADLDAIVEACRLAGIHEAIDRLPLGYNTVLGERGLGLSGGQKQRLAIARALLKKPAVLLFDEATSSLDLPAAEALARTINSLKGKVTILFIAHNKPPGLLVDDYLELGNHAARVESVTRAGEAVT